MLLGGDEFLRTQRGNNNAYCQDNETSWYDWTLREKNADILAFCRRAIAFRQTFSVLRGAHFFAGAASAGSGLPDIVWYDASLQRPAWENPATRTVCYQIAGGADERSRGSYLLFFILHAGAEPITVRLPEPQEMVWRRIVDTALPPGEDFVDPPGAPLASPYRYQAAPRSLVMLLSTRQ